VVETLGNPRNIVLDGGPDFSRVFDAAFARLLWALVNAVCETGVSFERHSFAV